LIWGSGETWKEIRRFTARGLKEFGFGRKMALESQIQAEISALILHLSKKASLNDGILAIDSHDFSASSINILWSLVAGERFALDDPHIKRGLQLSDMQIEMISFDVAYNIFPALKDWFPSMSNHQRHLDMHNQVRQFMTVGNHTFFAQTEMH
jgi:hypothetical protein